MAKRNESNGENFSFLEALILSVFVPVGERYGLCAILSLVVWFLWVGCFVGAYAILWALCHGRSLWLHFRVGGRDLICATQKCGRTTRLERQTEASIASVVNWIQHVVALVVQ